MNKLTQIETEGVHYERLIEALSRFREAASRREWDTGWLNEATQHSVAIGTYRDDNRWFTVAAALDELGKRPPAPTELASSITKQLDFMIQTVKRLRDRRLH